MTPGVTYSKRVVCSVHAGVKKRNWVCQDNEMLLIWLQVYRDASLPSASWCTTSESNFCNSGAAATMLTQSHILWTEHISAVPQVKALVYSSQNICAGGGRECRDGRAGHLLGNRAWAWDVRTNLWDKRLGWMAWLGAKPGLGTWVTPAWLMEVIEPTTVPAKVWPKANGVAPKTCCPLPLFPEEAMEEDEVLLLLLLTVGVAWSLWVAVPTAAKYKAVGCGSPC